jgi:hypothetical protein
MRKWHSIKFTIKWDGISAPKFFIDLIIMDLLVAPVIERFKSEFEVWRFHRRAIKDKRGHELSLLLYVESNEANEMFEQIASNNLFTLIKRNYLKSNIELESGPREIEGRGDNSWPEDINKVWPYYMTGVCNMFVNLIKEIKANRIEKIDVNNAQNEIEDYYEELGKEIAAKWFKYGSHAFLHHMGAIFGYELIFLRPRYIDEKSRGVIL